jgi:thiol-disulfide isomerase/thioredoxin
MQDLVSDQEDSKLYDLLLSYHSDSPKLGQIVHRRWADEKFLRAVTAKSPHSQVRGKATLALAARLAQLNRAGEAESMLETLLKDKELADLAKTAESLLFEIRHLEIGKTVPEIDGSDMDKKPMRLSQFRGKVVMLVFWATWCEPCMKMVPHERALAKRLAGRPFAVVGINGDVHTLFDAKGKEIDNWPRVQQIIIREQITWPSFLNYARGRKESISQWWNVRDWPTVFLIDHQGVIRHRFRGMPQESELDAAIDRLVAAVENEKRDPDKK